MGCVGCSDENANDPFSDINWGSEIESPDTNESNRRKREIRQKKIKIGLDFIKGRKLKNKRKMRWEKYSSLLVKSSEYNLS